MSDRRMTTSVTKTADVMSSGFMFLRTEKGDRVL